MNFKFKYTDKIVGLFFIISVFLLIASIILVAINQKVLIKKYYFNTIFEDSNGLKINQDILLKGFKIGKTHKIALNQKNQVIVDFFIYEDYIDKIKENSVLNKLSNPLTGSTLVFIPNALNNRIASEYSFIPSLDTEEGKYLLNLGAVIDKKADAISSIIDNVDRLLNSLNSDHNAGDSSIARILVNAADIVESIKYDMKTLKEMLGYFNELARNIRNPDGLIQRMLDPDGKIMFNSIRESLNHLEMMMEQLESFSRFINGQSTQIETLLTEGKMTIQSAREIVESIKNNPLIKGGIQEKKDQDMVKQNFRDRDF